MPGICLLALVLLVAAVFGSPEAALGAASVTLYDANIRYTSGIFIPLRQYKAATVEPFTTGAWTVAARPIDGLAADGVTLLLVKVTLPAKPAGAVRVSLASDVGDADPGGLWAVDDLDVVDASRAGGTIDTPTKKKASKGALKVKSFLIGQQRFAFFLYRAPRNFDSATGSTDLLDSRTARIVVRPPRSAGPTVSVAVTIVRPLVVFIHGTSADNDAWVSFPLWANSANELNDFQRPPQGLPFQSTRISFHWIWNSTGGVLENADTILPQLVTALRDWREAVAVAATQADVVTHSFGGFIARQVAQTQPDPDPLTPESLHNFRSAANWGHGLIQKLITLAATHRGSEGANGAAYINANGQTPGELRKEGCMLGNYIDQGAIRDQMVLSPALRALGQTRLPGHAVAGSGRAALDPTGFYTLEELGVASLDRPDGPYATAFQFNMGACSYDSLANYSFNLEADFPPISGTGDTCSVTPNYDLVVSAYSSQGRLPVSATTSALDLDPTGGLVGKLNHSALHDPAFGSPEIVATVSNRIVFLLRQATTSTYFSYFPAVAAAPPTPLERRFTQEYASAWLEVGDSCPDPSYDPTCPTYSAIKVVPNQLQLADSTRTPLYVYGRLNNQWLLAYSPTSSSSSSRNCAVTFTSSDVAVVDFATNDVTKSETAIATGVGNATIEVSVQGVAGSLSVPVSVTGVSN